MRPAVPSLPALFVAATAQHACQVRFQRTEEDQVLGPSLEILVLAAVPGCGGGRGEGLDGWGKGRGVPEEEMRSRTQWRGT